MLLVKADAWLELTAYTCALVEDFYLTLWLIGKTARRELWKAATALVVIVSAPSVAAIAENVSIASGPPDIEVSLVLVVGLLGRLYALVNKISPTSFVST